MAALGTEAAASRSTSERISISITLIEAVVHHGSFSFGSNLEIHSNNVHVLNAHQSLSLVLSGRLQRIVI
jgi:hypothetical protein